MDRTIVIAIDSGGNPTIRRTIPRTIANSPTIPACLTRERNSMKGIAPITTLSPSVASIMTGVRKPNMVTAK